MRAPRTTVPLLAVVLLVPLVTAAVSAADQTAALHSETAQTNESDANVTVANATVLTGPKRIEDRLDDSEAIRAAMRNGTLQPDDSVSPLDTIVLSLRLPGMAERLEQYDGANDTVQFVNATNGTGDQLYLFQMNPNTHRRAKILGLFDPGAMTVVPDRERDTYYLLLSDMTDLPAGMLDWDGNVDWDTEYTRKLSVNDAFRLNVTLDGHSSERSLVPGENQEFGFAEAFGGFVQYNGDHYVVKPTDNREIRLRTGLAPETRAVVRITNRSDGGKPIVKTVQVTEGTELEYGGDVHTASTTANISGLTPGSTFDLEFVVDGEVYGRSTGIVSNATASVDIPFDEGWHTGGVLVERANLPRSGFLVAIAGDGPSLATPDDYDYRGHISVSAGEHQYRTIPVDNKKTRYLGESGLRHVTVVPVIDVDGDGNLTDDDRVYFEDNTVVADTGNTTATTVSVNATDLTVWTGPEQRRDRLEDLEDIRAAKREEALRQDPTLVRSDTLVLSLGIKGMDERLARYGGANETMRFIRSISGTDSSLRLEQTNPTVEKPPKVMELSDPGVMTVVPDRVLDTYHLVLDLRALPVERLGGYEGDVDGDQPAVGDEFRLNVTLDGETTLFGPTADDQYRSVVTVAAPDAEIRPDGGKLFIDATARQAIRAATGFAPGTEATVRLSNRSDDGPPLVSRTSVVEQPVADDAEPVRNHSIVATLNTSELAAGTTVDVSIVVHNTTVATRAGVVDTTDAAIATPTIPDRDDDRVEISRVTLSEGGFLVAVAGERTEPAAPEGREYLGHVPLDDGTHRNVTLQIEPTAEPITVIAVLDDGDGGYGIEDRAYVENGTVVSATVTVAAETTTERTTAASSPDRAPTTTVSETTAEGGPGFTAALALLAVLAAGLLAARGGSQRSGRD